MSQIIQTKPQTQRYDVKPRSEQGVSSSSAISVSESLPAIATHGYDVFTTQQSTKAMDEIAKQLEDKIKYLPEKDPSYKDKKWYSFSETFFDYFSRLPIICNIPLIGDPEFKNEYEQYCKQLNTSSKPPLEKSITVLTDATKLLNSKGYMTDKSWRTISQTMRELLAADMRRKLASYESSTSQGLNAIDPFGFCPQILNNDNVKGLHPFVVSALGDLPQLKNVEKLGVHAKGKLKSTVKNLMTKATLKAYENVALRNIALLLDAKQIGEVSSFEVDLLTRMVKQLPADFRRTAKLHLYGGQEIASSNFISDKGTSLLPADRIEPELHDKLRGVISETMTFNQKYVDAVWDFSKTLAERDDEMESTIKSLVKEDMILDFPTGAALRAHSDFTRYFELTSSEKAEVANTLLTDPKLKYYRLTAADVIKKNGLLSRQELQRRLAPLGISERDLSHFDQSNMDALMARMNEVVIGQFHAKAALQQQLQKLGTRETPLLYLDGAYGSGKTSMGLKLAQQLNTSLARQNYGTGIESFEASSTNAHMFNAAVIPMQDLFDTDDPDVFRHNLMEKLKEAEANSKKFPGRPTVLIFDEIGRTVEEWQNPFHPEYNDDGTDLALPNKKTMHAQFAKTLLQLLQTHGYTDAKTRQTVRFNNPIVFLTGNVGVEMDSKNPMHTPLFHPAFVGQQEAERLTTYLNQDNVVEFEPFTLDDRKGLVKYYDETILPAAAALKGYHLNRPLNFVKTLSQVYENQGFLGRSINMHLEKALMPLVTTDKKNPGDTITIRIDQDELQNLTLGTVNDNKPFVAC